MHLQLSTSPYKNGKELATGEPIKHLDDIRELHRCLLLPTEVAVVKCKGHTGGSDWISKGNEAADIAAMNAAGYILNQKNQMMVTSEEAPIRHTGNPRVAGRSLPRGKINVETNGSSDVRWTLAKRR